MLELTRTTDAVAAPLVLATTLATLAVRYIDGSSIYPARLARRHDVEQNPVDTLNA